MATIAVRRPAASPLRRQETRAGLLFILPWIIALLVFTAYPTIATFYLSFTKYNIVQPPSWIGLDNYRTIFSADPAFWTAVRNSAIYALISVPLKLVIAFGLALLLNMGVRGIGVYRTIFYLPTLVPPIAAPFTFILLFSAGGGPINTIIGWLGLRAPDWLNDPHWALPALIVLGIWPLGVETLAFLAGLKEIPQDLLDAAAVDGAQGWQRLWSVTLPLLSPVILFNLVTGVIYSFQVFAQALVIGDTQGRPLESTLMYMVLIYRNAFRYFAMGYASAQAIVLFAVVALLTLLIFRSARGWVFYEGGER